MNERKCGKIDYISVFDVALLNRIIDGASSYDRCQNILYIALCKNLMEKSMAIISNSRYTIEKDSSLSGF